jgi:hypothetical protein
LLVMYNTQSSITIEENMEPLKMHVNSKVMCQFNVPNSYMSTQFYDTLIFFTLMNGFA